MFFNYSERAVECFQLRASGFHLGLASGGESSTRLWIVRQLLPLCAPGIDRGAILSPHSFRNFSRNAVIVRRQEGVALSDTDRVGGGCVCVG